MKTVRLVLFFSLLFLNLNSIFGQAISERKFELVTQVGNFDDVWFTEFSPDNKILASVSRFVITLLDVKTGRNLRTLEKDSTGISTFAFSQDGSFVAGGHNNIEVWKVETGQIVRRFDVSTNNMIFSPDGKFLFAGNEGKFIAVCNLRTGKIQQFLRGHKTFIEAIAFDKENQYLISIDSSGTLIRWNLQTGQKLNQITVYKQSEINIYGISNEFKFTSDGNKLASKIENSPIHIWDVKTGKLLQTLEDSQNTHAINFTADNSQLAAAEESGNRIIFWDNESGTQNRSFEVAEEIDRFSFSPDGEDIAFGMDNGKVKIYKKETGEEINTVQRKALPIQAFAVGASGKIMAVASGGLTGGVLAETETYIRLWDLTGNQSIRILKKDKSLDFNSLAFSPNEQKLAAVCDDKIFIWETANGTQLVEIPLNLDQYRIKFNPDGSKIAIFNLIYDVKQDGSVSKVRQSIKIFSATTGKIIPLPKVLPKWIDFDKGTSESSDRHIFRTFGRVFRAVSDLQEIKLFDYKNKKQVASIILFGDQDWLVKTPEGLFDGTPDAWKQLIWRFNNSTFDYAPVEAFFKEFYRPGLLQDIFAENKIEPPTKDLSKIDIRQPSLKISVSDRKTVNSLLVPDAIFTDKRSVRVKVEITDNNSEPRPGISKDIPSDAQDVRLFRNGSLVKLWNGNAFKLTDGDGCLQIPATNNSSRKAICETNVQIIAGKNEFTAYAFNHDNVKSSDANVVVNGEFEKRKGKLQILSIGINDYLPVGKSNYDLKFAVADAVDFGAELRKKQIDLANFDAPEIFRLTESEATKQNILYVLERFAKGERALKPPNLLADIEAKLEIIEKTQPEDILVIYFAGHGTASKDRFFLIPADGFPAGYQTEESRIELLQKQSISDLELEAVLRDLDAGQILFVIDACNSGQALESEEKRRGPMNSKGLAQIAFEKGMYILTAAQSYQAALEVARTPEGRKIEHGLLTFSLLEGMTNVKADADADKNIIEREWFSFAAAEVPRMQLEEMQKRNAELKRGDSFVKERSEIIFLNDDDKNLPPEKRGLQTPRIFYRRETTSNPLIISKP